MLTPPVADFGRASAAALTALHSPDGSPEAVAACLAELEQFVARLPQPYVARAVIRALHRERAALARPQDARQPESDLERAVQSAAHAVWWCHRPAGSAELCDFLRAQGAATRALVAAAMLESPSRELVRAVLWHVEQSIEETLLASVAVGSACAAA